MFHKMHSESLLFTTKMYQDDRSEVRGLSGCSDTILVYPTLSICVVWKILKIVYAKC